MKRHLSRWFAAFTLAFLATVASAQAPLAAGRDYVAIEPAQATDNPAKIEVIEFFSYACPHCSDLNPLIHQWAARLPSDVEFKRVPVSFSPYYQLMARLFYALETTGDLARLDAAVFNALHVKGLRLIDERSITDWVTSQGVDARKFSEAWNSFSVNSKTKRGHQMGQSARIQGVPALAVDGRYLVTGQNIKSYNDLLALTEKIIDMRRKERAKKK